MKRRVSELEMCSATNGAPGRQLLRHLKHFVCQRRDWPKTRHTHCNKRSSLQQQCYPTGHKVECWYCMHLL